MKFVVRVKLEEGFGKGPAEMEIICRNNRTSHALHSLIQFLGPHRSGRRDERCSGDHRENGFYLGCNTTFAPPDFLIIVPPEHTMPLSPSVHTYFFPLHLCQNAILPAFHL